tara:strand:+ start:782 stop:910 length:129 start_codon:yes stop_codon:yes gene_type:complete
MWITGFISLGTMRVFGVGVTRHFVILIRPMINDRRMLIAVIL